LLELSCLTILCSDSNFIYYIYFYRPQRSTPVVSVQTYVPLQPLNGHAQPTDGHEPATIRSEQAQPDNNRAHMVYGTLRTPTSNIPNEGERDPLL